MLLPDLEALAERIVPGQGRAAVRRLSSGLLNETYQVTRDGSRYLLRTAREQAPVAQDRAFELRVLGLAAQAGLAPPLLYADVQSGTQLRRWIAGRVWSESESRQPEAIARLAELLRAVHALPIPESPRTSSPAEWIGAYGAALGADSGAARRFGSAAQLALARLQALPEVRRVVCHSDVHRFNILEPEARGASLLLLDWEYSHLADPHWDLAGWSANNDLPQDAQRALLAAYWGSVPSAERWQRFTLQFWLYDYVCLLWTELYLSSRPPDGALHRQRARWLESRLAAPVYGTITG